MSCSKQTTEYPSSVEHREAEGRWQSLESLKSVIGCLDTFSGLWFLLVVGVLAPRLLEREGDIRETI